MLHQLGRFRFKSTAPSSLCRWLFRHDAAVARARLLVKLAGISSRMLHSGNGRSVGRSGSAVRRRGRLEATDRPTSATGHRGSSQMQRAGEWLLIPRARSPGHTAGADLAWLACKDPGDPERDHRGLARETGSRFRIQETVENYSAVVGLIIDRTCEISFAGKPPRCACSRIISSLGAR